MKAIIQNSFGHKEVLKIEEIDVPQISQNEVLIKLSFAGIGQWDAFEREGGYDKLLNKKSDFPYILGSEGTGEVVEVGHEVKKFKIGDIVSAVSFLNDKGGFYSEYVAVPEENVYPKPKCLSLMESAVISGVGMTAFRGLIDVMKIKKNEKILVFGASGGVGHLAVQIAKSVGASVYAIASGEDGVELVSSLEIDKVIDGKSKSVEECMDYFGIDSFDAAFFTSGGKAANPFVNFVKKHGRIVYPNGIEALSISRGDLKVEGYFADIDEKLINSFEKWINEFTPKVNVHEIYKMNEFEKAHTKLESHYLGKLCFKI